MKYVLIAVIGLVSIVFLMFYGTWAWSHVFDWYLTNYLSKYFEWAKNIPLKSLQALFLAMSVVYSAWWGSKAFTSDSKDSSDTGSSLVALFSDTGTSLVALFIVALVLPWFMQFVLFLQVSWFNL